MNVVVAGPCGVGKSTIAESFAQSVGIVYLDFDELRAIDMEERKGAFSPCSVSKLHLKECLPAKLDKISSSFILDFGGDTVFRDLVNNEDRLDQILWLKENYSVKIILFITTKENLSQRFVASKKNRDLTEFERLWLDWQNIAELYWRRCADLIVDTTTLSIDDTVIKMKIIFD
jgi:hypothetical protein